MSIRLLVGAIGHSWLACAAVAVGLSTGALASCSEPAATQVVLSAGRPLSAALLDLRVRRDPPGAEPWFDEARHSARAMHERGAKVPTQAMPGVPGEGEVLGRWALGSALWDCVGLTRQRSRGALRTGLWAHPRDGTRLDIEATVHLEGEGLAGFAGFSDFSLEQARRLGVDDPVRLSIALDGRRLHETSLTREPGWREFSIELPHRQPGSARLTVRVTSPRDKWAHFVFDLWGVSREAPRPTMPP